MHCVAETQASADSEWAASIAVGVASAGANGLKLSSFPDPSTTVHCVIKGHAIA